jgi:curved DNA-binding protein CbpA
MKNKTLYDELAVDQDAAPETIKKAFRKKAKQTHPDKGGDPEHFKSIVRAYDILSDEEKRKRYDAGENPEYINQPQKDRVLSTVFKIFNTVVDQNIDPIHNNLFDIIRACIRTDQQNYKIEKGKNQKILKDMILF